MAGIRIGTAFAAPSIISIMNKVKFPYNIGMVNQNLALKALDNLDKKNKYVKEILSEKEKLIENLSGLRIVKQISPSDANFLLVKFSSADKIYEFLRSEGIIVRNRSTEMNCENCLRITVGTEDQNKELLKSLKKFER